MPALAETRPIPVETETSPHNLEAEQALLGAILFNNEVYNRIGDYLQPQHFYDPVHARIFASLASLIGRGALADAVVLKNRFERDEGLEEIGGTEYLALLLSQAPSGAAAPEYAQLIFDRSPGTVKPYMRCKIASLTRGSMSSPKRTGIFMFQAIRAAKTCAKCMIG